MPRGLSPTRRRLASRFAEGWAERPVRERYPERIANSTAGPDRHVPFRPYVPCSGHHSTNRDRCVRYLVIEPASKNRFFTANNHVGPQNDRPFSSTCRPSVQKGASRTHGERARISDFARVCLVRVCSDVMKNRFARENPAAHNRSRYRRRKSLTHNTRFHTHRVRLTKTEVLTSESKLGLRIAANGFLRSMMQSYCRDQPFPAAMAVCSTSIIPRSGVFSIHCR